MSSGAPRYRQLLTSTSLSPSNLCLLEDRGVCTGYCSAKFATQRLTYGLSIAVCGTNGGKPFSKMYAQDNFIREVNDESI